MNSLGNRQIEIARNQVTLQLRSEKELLFFQMDAFILNKLGIITPSQKISKKLWSYLQDLSLADPTYTVPRSVDLILGADTYGMWLVDGIRRGPPNSFIAIRTVYGGL